MPKTRHSYLLIKRENTPAGKETALCGSFSSERKALEALQVVTGNQITLLQARFRQNPTVVKEPVQTLLSAPGTDIAVRMIKVPQSVIIANTL